MVKSKYLAEKLLEVAHIAKNENIHDMYNYSTVADRYLVILHMWSQRNDVFSSPFSFGAGQPLHKILSLYFVKVAGEIAGECPI